MVRLNLPPIVNNNNNRNNDRRQNNRHTNRASNFGGICLFLYTMDKHDYNILRIQGHGKLPFVPVHRTRVREKAFENRTVLHVAPTVFVWSSVFARRPGRPRCAGRIFLDARRSFEPKSPEDTGHVWASKNEKAEKSRNNPHRLWRPPVERLTQNTFVRHTKPSNYPRSDCGFLLHGKNPT